MVEILKKGDIGENWSMEVTCRECKSLLRVHVEDLKRDQYGGDQREPHSSYDRCRTKCPVCGYSIYVCNTDELPRVLQKKVGKRW